MSHKHYNFFQWPLVKTQVHVAPLEQRSETVERKKLEQDQVQGGVGKKQEEWKEQQATEKPRRSSKNTAGQ